MCFLATSTFELSSFALLQGDQQPHSRMPALPSAPAVLEPALAQLLDSLAAALPGVNLKDLVLAQMQQAASASSSAADALASDVHEPTPSLEPIAEVALSVPVVEPEKEQQDAQGYVDDTYADQLMGDFVDPPEFLELPTDEPSPKPAKRAKVTEPASPTAATLPGDPFSSALADESQAVSVVVIQETQQAQIEVQSEAKRMSQKNPPLNNQTPAAVPVPKQPHPAPSSGPISKPLVLPQPQPELARSSAQQTPLGSQAPPDAQQQLQLQIEKLQTALAAALAFQSQMIPPKAPNAQQISPTAALPHPQSTPGHTASVALPQVKHVSPPVVSLQHQPIPPKTNAAAVAPQTTPGHKVASPLVQQVSPPVESALPATAAVATQRLLQIPSLKSFAHRGPPPPGHAIPSSAVFAQQTFSQAAPSSSQSLTSSVDASLAATEAIQQKEDALNLGSRH